MYKIYQIEYGDTVEIIANKSGTTADNIRKINDLKSDNELVVGNLIIVPKNNNMIFCGAKADLSWHHFFYGESGILFTYYDVSVRLHCGQIISMSLTQEINYDLLGCLYCGRMISAPTRMCEHLKNYFFFRED